MLQQTNDILKLIPNMKRLKRNHSVPSNYIENQGKDKNHCEMRIIHKHMCA